MNIVILAVTRRMGSTLLQRIFNARKETLIWGEHNGVLRNFLDTQEQVKFFTDYDCKTKREYFKTNNPNIWTATMCPDTYYVDSAVAHSIKTFLDELYSQWNHLYDIIGFKEVVYDINIAKLLHGIYGPDLKIIFLCRHPIPTWKSILRKKPEMTWFANVQDFMDRWNTVTQDFMEYSKDSKDAYFIRYEDLIKYDTATINTIKRVGKLTDEQIMNVLAVKLDGNKHHNVSSSHLPIMDASYIKNNIKVNIY